MLRALDVIEDLLRHDGTEHRRRPVLFNASEIEIGQLVEREFIEIAHVVHEPRLDEFCDRLGAESLYIGGSPAHPVAEAFLELSRARAVLATERDLVLVVMDG